MFYFESKIDGRTNVMVDLSIYTFRNRPGTFGYAVFINKPATFVSVYLTYTYTEEVNNAILQYSTIHNKTFMHSCCLALSFVNHENGIYLNELTQCFVY